MITKYYDVLIEGGGSPQGTEKGEETVSSNSENTSPFGEETFFKNGRELSDALTAIRDQLDEAHTLLSKTKFLSEEYNPISLLLAKTKLDLLQWHKQVIMLQDRCEVGDEMYSELIRESTPPPADNTPAKQGEKLYRWVKASERLPGINKVVKWRNAAGGNIPLGENIFLNQYQKVGPNTSWHEWLEELPSPTESMGDSKETAVDVKEAAEIAQWVIDNRYAKTELWKVSDHEMYHEIVDRINALAGAAYKSEDTSSEGQK